MKTETKFKQTEIGLIPEDWEVKELEKEAEINMGQSPKSEFYNQEGKGIRFLQGIRTFGDKYPEFDTYTNKITKKGVAGSVLFSVRAPVGEVNITNQDLCIGRGISAINMKNGNNEFLYYLLKNFKTRILNFESGSVFGSINGKQIKKLKFAFPKENEQSAIAKILSDLDSKIELLQKQNETLEKIGQAMFKQRFVDFEFPNEDGKPYKSSGGEMVESELGEIPKGWSVGKLGDLILKNRKSITDYENWKDKDLIDLSNMPQFSMSITTFDKGEKFKSNIFELDEMDILFGSIRPYFGKYGFSPIKGAITGTVYSLKPKEEYYYAFVLNIICRREFVDYTVRLSKGTKMPIIGWNDFSNFDVIINKEMITKFNKIIYPSILKIKTNILQILNLQKTRDLLLPKLMTGKIRVPLGVEE